MSIKIEPARQTTLQACYRDFAIVCFQRSGSHLLATALDSHPEICCQGELLQAIKTPHKTYAPVPALGPGLRGAIIMYSQWKVADRLGLTPRKLIHLMRDPVATAVSVARNAANSRTRGAQHQPHAHRGSPQMQVSDFDASVVPSMTERIRGEQSRMSRLLAERALTVSYEELSADRDVDTLPTAASIRILEFLGVREPGLPLRPSTIKTS